MSFKLRFKFSFFSHPAKNGLTCKAAVGNRGSVAGFFLEHFLPASLSVLSFPSKPDDARKEKEKIYLTSTRQRQFCFSLAVAGIQIGFSSCGCLWICIAPQFLAISHLHSLSQTSVCLCVELAAISTTSYNPRPLQCALAATSSKGGVCFCTLGFGLALWLALVNTTRWKKSVPALSLGLRKPYIPLLSILESCQQTSTG